MSSRKRRRSPRKMSLRAKVVVYACLLVVPTVLGGACGALQHLVPARRTFGQSQQTDEPSDDITAAVVQRCLTGAATGGGWRTLFELG